MLESGFIDANEKLCNESIAQSPHVSMTQSSAATINSNPPSVSGYHNTSFPSKQIVMINPEFLKRNNVRFGSSLNLKSYKSSTVDNSTSNGKEKNAQKFPSPDSVLLSDLHNIQRVTSVDKVFSVTKELTPSIEKKRKASSVNGNFYATPRNPRARVVSCSSAGSFLVKKSSSRTDDMIVKPSSRLANADYMLPNTTKPSSYILDLLAHHDLKSDQHIDKSLSGFFDEIRVEHYDDYNEQLVAATYSQDINKLRQLKHESLSFNSCNRLGDSLIHIACQRGFADVVKFFVMEGGATLRIRNDYGRTPMHDACLSPSPNFALMEFLMEEEPALLFIRDSKGLIPVDYVRREYWDNLVSFLASRKQMILDGWEKY